MKEYNEQLTIDSSAIADRLKAYRLGKSLTAEELAAQLGVSRAVVYRLEKGEIVKIETLEKIAVLLGTTLASIMGVEVEYYTSSLSLFERMRQLEMNSDRILAHFDPISVLLTSENYLNFLKEMLYEGKNKHIDDMFFSKQIDNLFDVINSRRQFFNKKKPHIISLMGLRDIERFIDTGLVGRLDLPENLKIKRKKAAIDEIYRIIDLMEDQPINIQIGLIDETMPSSTFQVLSGFNQRVLVTSPFRLGEMPNISNGIGTITSSPEAVALHENLILELWRRSYKGRAGAQILRKSVENLVRI